jgi:hypothetical protein
MRWLILLAMCAAPLCAQPVMVVLRGAEVIADAGTDSLENTGVSPFNLTYTVRNDGATDLNLTGVPLVAISGEVNCTVSVIQEPAVLVPASGGTTTFRLQVSPIAATDFSFEVSVANDDPVRNPYNFKFEGDPTKPAEPDAGKSEDDGCAAGGRRPLAILAILGVMVGAWLLRHKTRDRLQG